MPRRIEISASFELRRCTNPACASMHLVLFDEDGEPYADCAIGLASIPSIIETMRNHAYEMNALRDDNHD